MIKSSAPENDGRTSILSSPSSRFRTNRALRADESFSRAYSHSDTTTFEFTEKPYLYQISPTVNSSSKQLGFPALSPSNRKGTIAMSSDAARSKADPRMKETQKRIATNRFDLPLALAPYKAIDRSRQSLLSNGKVFSSRRSLQVLTAIISNDCRSRKDKKFSTENRINIIFLQSVD